MSSFVKQVFYILGAMTLSLLLWSLLFGATGRTLFWSAMSPIFQAQWKAYTLNDGQDINNKLTEIFDFDNAETNRNTN